MNKQQIREYMKNKRALLSKEYRETASKTIFEKVSSFLLEDDSIFLYLSMDCEVDTRMYLGQYKNISIPKCFRGGIMTAVSGYTHLDTTPFGTTEPVDGYEVTDIDVAIVPGLAFSETMGRVGYGAGYYDRFLRKYPDIFKIGVCYDCQVVDELVTNEFDIPMDCVITEKRIIKREDR